ncbi:hypothetical protein DY245_20890 [Streptomyces inhibens]|uniref:Uncharacterized protein n=1 Tax=Streptomyces inhibens TaxID=2293571 RepID=A0A371Q1I4_STRIH|nr:hypothetical protein DY245_20890 [Streptomyces inhibens]
MLGEGKGGSALGQADQWIVRAGAAAVSAPGLADALDGTRSDVASTAAPATAVMPTVPRFTGDIDLWFTTGREGGSEAFMAHTLTAPHDDRSMGT